jgi:hypothetical protein
VPTSAPTDAPTGAPTNSHQSLLDIETVEREIVLAVDVSGGRVVLNGTEIASLYGHSTSAEVASSVNMFFSQVPASFTSSKSISIDPVDPGGAGGTENDERFVLPAEVSSSFLSGRDAEGAIRAVAFRSALSDFWQDTGSGATAWDFKSDVGGLTLHDGRGDEIYVANLTTPISVTLFATMGQRITRDTDCFFLDDGGGVRPAMWSTKGVSVAARDVEKIVCKTHHLSAFVAAVAPGTASKDDKGEGEGPTYQPLSDGASSRGPLTVIVFLITVMLVSIVSAVIARDMRKSNEKLGLGVEMTATPSDLAQASPRVVTMFAQASGALFATLSPLAVETGTQVQTMDSLIRPLIRPLIHPLIHPLIRPLINPLVHPLMHHSSQYGALWMSKRTKPGSSQRYTIHSSPALLSCTPLLHSSHILLSSTPSPLIHSLSSTPSHPQLSAEKSEFIVAKEPSPTDAKDRKIPIGAQVTMVMQVKNPEAFSLHATEDAIKTIEWQGSRMSHEWLLRCKPHAASKTFPKAFVVKISWEGESEMYKVTKEVTGGVEVLPPVS